MKLRKDLVSFYLDNKQMEKARKVLDDMKKLQKEIGYPTLAKREDGKEGE